MAGSPTEGEFASIFPERKYGVRVPPGFNGSQIDIIETLFEMTAFTIETEKLYDGWTITLYRSPVGEWRYSLVPKEKYART